MSLINKAKFIRVGMYGFHFGIARACDMEGSLLNLQPRGMSLSAWPISACFIKAFLEALS